MEWQPIETAPQTGEVIFVWADGFEYPEAVRWVDYDDELREELGADGYWTYAEELLADVVDSMGEEEWTLWVPNFTPTPEGTPR